MKTLKAFLKIVLVVTTLNASAQTIDTTLDPFNKISVRNNSKVTIQTGPQSVKILNANDPNTVKISSVNGTLTIKGSSATILITMPELTGAEISGTGSITADSVIRTQNLRLDISGSGKITLKTEASRVQCGISGVGKLNISGSADEMEVNISGTGKIYGQNFEVGTCEANISGVGKCYVDVKNDLQLNISGTGSFYYKKQPPKIGTHISGIGKYGVYPENKVVIIEDNDEDYNDDSSDNTTVIFGGSDFSIADSIFKKPAKSRSHWGGIDLGFNMLMVGNEFTTNLPDDYDYLELNTGNSVNVNINFFYHDFKIYKRYVMFTTGLGLTLQNYRFTSNETLVADTNIVTAGYDYTKNGNQISYQKNKLAVNYITLPLLIQFNTDERLKKSFHIATGILFSYKYNSHLKLVYSDDGDKNKSKRQDNFNTEPLRYDATLRFGYRLYTVYASYALNSLFQDGRGPELHPFNVGINILGW